MSFGSKSVSKACSGASNFLTESSTRSNAVLKHKIGKKGESADTLEVERRLRNIIDFKDLKGDELKDMVEKLTNPEEIIYEFSHLLDNQYVEVVQKMAENKMDFVDPGNIQEVAVAKASEQQRYTRVATLPLKITVTDLEQVTQKVMSLLCPIGNFLCTDYGAKHVSLTIGNVVLEWGKGSLVIPQRVEKGDEVCPDGDVRDITKHCPHNIQADREAPIPDAPLQSPVEEAEHLFKLVGETKPLFEALSKLIAKYNTRFMYHPVSRNCQGFVSDALKCLGIVEKPPSVQDGEYLLEVREKKHQDVPSSFKRHEDLDAYIMKQTQESLDHLDPDSLEYLQLAYMQFHGDIACHIPTCRANVLADTVRKRL